MESQYFCFVVLGYVSSVARCRRVVNGFVYGSTIRETSLVIAEQRNMSAASTIGAKFYGGFELVVKLCGYKGHEFVSKINFATLFKRGRL